MDNYQSIIRSMLAALEAEKHKQNILTKHYQFDILEVVQQRKKIERKIQIGDWLIVLSET